MCQKINYLCYAFFIISNISAQDFRLKKIEKYPNKSPINLFSTIAVDDFGTLFYSMDGGVVEDSGFINSLHEITKENSQYRLKLSFQLKTSPNHGLFLSTSKGIYYINTQTNERKWVWNAKDFTGKKDYFNYTFTLDLKGHLWVFYYLNKKIYLLNVNENQTFEFKGDTAKIVSFISKNMLRNMKMKIRNHADNISIVIRNMLFSLNTIENYFQLCHFNSSKETSILLLNNQNDQISSHLQKDKLKPKNAESLISCPKKNINFIEVKGIGLTQIDSEDLRFNGQRADFFVVNNNEIEFYKIKKSTQGSYPELITKFKHKREIKEIEYFEQNIFFLDEGNLLYKITNEQSGFENIDFNPNKSIRGIVSNEESLTYVVTETKGGEVYEIYKEGRKRKLPLDNKSFKIPEQLYNLHLEGDSLLWIISRRLTLIKYNLKTEDKEIIDYRKNSKKISKIRTKSYVEMNKNELLFYDGENLTIFNKRTKSFKLHRAIFESKVSLNKLLRRKTEIWIGTDGDGLYRYNELTNSWIHYHTNAEVYKISGDYVFDLHFMKNGNLLVASNNGLDQLDVKKNSIQNFVTDNGLPDNRVVSIIETQDEFWLGTFNGLSRMSKKDNRFYNFFKENGLPENEFNKNSSFKLNDSVIFLGGMNGLIKFNPKKIFYNDRYDYIKPLQIEYFDNSIHAKRIKKYNFNGLQEIIIPFDHNYINFYIGGANKGNLLYKLDDGEWTISESSKVLLQGLSTGDHTLTIKSRFNSSNTLTYKLLVQEVFYKRSWFHLLGFAVFFVLIMYFLWNRANKKDKEYRLILKTRKLEDLALRYQMSPHFIKNAINNIQSTLFLKGEKTASKYISNLATMIRFTLYNAGKDRVNLKEELNYLRAYISMEHLRRNGEFDYEIKIEGFSDIEKIEFPPMLFQPIVENAILHGLSGHKGEKKLEVKFRKQGNYISGEIIDNGNGFYFGNDDSVDKQESVANKIINQRIEIYNQQIRDYLSFHIVRVDNKTIATIKILIVKPDEF